ncbi:extracellular solute-binding protein family 1 [Paenibacillus curdlanolyticus YK9]|uniref:Extracellular solute-binding protein family 1 n=1 Tax=Paenibacillus curdlanolyticus YK9 TaxID=717606 RepID=E0ICS2_9BACL|nr:extracellular solute-binding protein [Paenibacillus curdlanolyticus]EFM09958.1 extracellular solute-binding protein family 1 [Paenibacillus curdlanolyticus YK9]
MKKPAVILAVFVILLSVAACGDGRTSGLTGGRDIQNSDSSIDGENGQPQTITLKLFTALSDRMSGAGKVEQAIIDQYMIEHPSIKIEVEALQDEPYKSKMKIYSSTNSLPDIIQTWGQSSFIKPLIDNKMLLELPAQKFAESGFIKGATEGFSQDGKLYGLPRSTDYLVLYYNKKMFADNKLSVPTSFDELKALVKTLRAKGINPIAVNGMDRWVFPIWFEYTQQRQTGSFDRMDDALARKIKFTEPSFIAAATQMQELAQAGGFADGYLTADYGAARNLFGQGNAAMYLVGNWELGIATDANFTPQFRQYVGAFSYPASDKGAATDVAAWFGGGYSVSSASKHPEEALQFLEYFFKPEHWANTLWANGVGTPASRFVRSSNETALQQELFEIFSSMTSSSGTPVLDTSTVDWKEAIMDLNARLLNGQLTPKQFVEELDKAADIAASVQY